MVDTKKLHLMVEEWLAHSDPDAKAALLFTTQELGVIWLLLEGALNQFSGEGDVVRGDPVVVSFRKKIRDVMEQGGFGEEPQGGEAGD